jgi:hypothetical protein
MKALAERWRGLPTAERAPFEAAAAAERAAYQRDAPVAEQK